MTSAASETLSHLDAELVKYEQSAPYMDTFREHAGPFVFEFFSSARCRADT